MNENYDNDDKDSNNIIWHI